MRATEEQHNARKREMMEKCFECYAENGLTGTGIKALAAAALREIFIRISAEYGQQTQPHHNRGGDHRQKDKGGSAHPCSNNDKRSQNRIHRPA